MGNDIGYLFMCLIFHLSILFGKMPVYVFCLYSDWIVCLLLHFESFFYSRDRGIFGGEATAGNKNLFTRGSGLESPEQQKTNLGYKIVSS